ncbi:MAG: hypothetical protein ABFC90_10955 [Bacteroidales bacterium]|nr:hypothetical protein [Bacteroidales bacterium]
MTDNTFIKEYSDVISYSKDFKAIAAYLLVTDIPNAESLESNVKSVTKNPKFTLWKCLSSYESNFIDNHVGYNNLVGFFKYFGIKDMDEFSNNKIGYKIFKYLKSNVPLIKLFWNSRDESSVEFNINYKDIPQIRFQHENGFLMCVDIGSANGPFNCYCRWHLINSYLLDIKRIDKKINNEWVPVILKIEENYFSLTAF